MSTEGSPVVVSGFGDRADIIEMQAKDSKPMTWPGRWGPIIGFAGPNAILYWGLPTTGVAQQWASVGSPLVRRKHMLTIKIADLSSGEFQTVVEAIDSRHAASYGEVRPGDQR